MQNRYRERDGDHVVSARLLAATPEEVEAVVQAAFERVRVFFEADRCGLLSVNADRTASFVRFAALADGLELPRSEANLVELFPWIAQKLGLGTTSWIRPGRTRTDGGPRWSPTPLQLRPPGTGKALRWT